MHPTKGRNSECVSLNCDGVCQFFANVLCSTVPSRDSRPSTLGQVPWTKYQRPFPLLFCLLSCAFAGDFSKIAHLVKGDNYRKSFHETGDPDSSVWSAGVCMGL